MRDPTARIPQYRQLISDAPVQNEGHIIQDTTQEVLILPKEETVRIPIF